MNAIRPSSTVRWTLTAPALIALAAATPLISAAENECKRLRVVPTGVRLDSAYVSDRDAFLPRSHPAPHGLQFGINDYGAVAGTMTVEGDEETETRAFLWTAVNQLDLSTPPVLLFSAGLHDLSVASGESSMVSMATDINNRFEIVGKYGGNGSHQLINGRPCIWWPEGSGAVTRESIVESFETEPTLECEEGLEFGGVATAISGDDPPIVVGILNACDLASQWPYLTSFSRRVEAAGHQAVLFPVESIPQPPSHYVVGRGETCAAGVFTIEDEIIVVGHESASGPCGTAVQVFGCPSVSPVWVPDPADPREGSYELFSGGAMGIEPLYWQIDEEESSFDPTEACDPEELWDAAGLLWGLQLAQLDVVIGGVEDLDYGAVVRASEPTGAIVGYTYAPTSDNYEELSCRLEMTVWDWNDPESGIRSLHLAIESEPEVADWSWGEAVARRGDDSVTAVGAWYDWSGTLFFGLLVDDALGAVPCGRRIDDIAILCPSDECACGQGDPCSEGAQGCMMIEWALDVNVHGLTVAVGSYFEGVNKVYEVFMVTQRSDLNGDGRVNGADLGLVIAAWYEADCRADVNGNGLVDGADLGLVIADWTGTGFIEVPYACDDPCEESLMLTGGNGFELALQAYGFEDVDALAAWLIENQPEIDLDSFGAGLAALTESLNASGGPEE